MQKTQEKKTKNMHGSKTQELDTQKVQLTLDNQNSKMLTSFKTSTALPVSPNKDNVDLKGLVSSKVDSQMNVNTTCN
ncbi:38327_t:CDS:2 [Gigaspora margarita]|uniref:38327_t:CDS:1 n=1 Tax=Gigaspora margarita TaxID=4874 RepID=A0ABN7UY23_GIGMA|nr:38327_t:CDS:2 [Gigaspora margarita]